MKSKKVLKKHLKNAKTIIIGEIHGVKENIDFLHQLVKLIGNDNLGFIAFEYPKEIQKLINNLPQSKSSFAGNPIISMLIKDGRFSIYHLEFLIWLKKQKIKIICIDPSKKDWNKRDKGMYRLFSKNVKSKNKKYIAVVGNLHAEKKAVEIEGKNCFPFGSYFKNNLTILLTYGKGEFYNFGLKQLPEYHADNQIKKTDSQTFEYFIPQAHPTI